ncbi:hypothetical protein [Salicibibacter cibi]|uniref:hypothetical protein n=1 Tax=Salicibibacter cibi TaxID=2743001 RepID=UPI001FE39D86|nr:hypothetical protein [Salicibibacter cibi]
MKETLRRIRHSPLYDQAEIINKKLQGHYAYYGVAGNFQSLVKVYEATVKYWRKMLSSRSRKGYVTWEKFHELRTLFPLLRPKISIPYRKLKFYAML